MSRKRQQGLVSSFGRMFRERQIYHRADGVVRFVKLTAKTQVAMAAITVAALSWVAYASVNVVFKEQVIASTDEKRRDQEAVYRTRLENVELAILEAKSLNEFYEREFQATIGDLRNQHETLQGLVRARGNVDQTVEELSAELARTGAPGGRTLKSTNRVMVDPVGREQTPRQSRQSALQDRARTRIDEQRGASAVNDDFLLNMRDETARMWASQEQLIAELEEELRRDIRAARSILDHTGVDLTFLIEGVDIAAIQALNTEDGRGGPLTPLTSIASSDTFLHSVNRIEGLMQDKARLNEVLKSVPLANPVEGRYRVSDLFGVRMHPIRRVIAPHKGMDFAPVRGRPAPPILAAAPGRVVFSGVRGGFGNTVEIDHGNGFMTRYAHLRRRDVRAGQTVDLNDRIGLMGSTGMSTGVHLHYEVLFEGRQINPQRFIEAGRYVFES